MRLHSGIAAATAAIVAVLFAPASALGTADLSVAVTATPSKLSLGGPESTEVTLAVTNGGPDPAAAVSGGATTATPELSFQGFVSISQGSAIQNTSSNPPINFNFGEIPSGATATLKWTLNDAQSGLGTTIATATTSTPESNQANNTGSASIEVVALVPSALSLPFGVQTIGGIGPPMLLTVTNEAAIPVQVSKIELAGVDFVTSADTCGGTTLGVGASCQLSSRFAPGALGDRSGKLTVLSTTSGVSPIEIALGGVGVSVPAVDTKSPELRLAGVPKSITAKRFRKGFTVAITADERVALEVELLGNARSGALASALDLRLFSRSLTGAVGTRKVRVKPKPRLIGKLRKKVTVQLEVVAIDSSGNRSTANRKITVKPARPAPRR